MRFYPIKKRFGDEAYDIREFIQPTTYAVESLFTRLWSQGVRDYLGFFNWVIENVKPLSADEEYADYHKLEAFLLPGRSRPKQVWETYDYWSFPAETLRAGYGDCEDKSFLLTSLLRHFIPEVYSSVGYFNGGGHVWTSIKTKNGFMVLETTLDKMPDSIEIEGKEYETIMRFNDEKVQEVSYPLVIPVTYKPKVLREISRYYRKH